MYEVVVKVVLSSLCTYRCNFEVVSNRLGKASPVRRQRYPFSNESCAGVQAALLSEPFSGGRRDACSPSPLFCASATSATGFGGALSLRNGQRRVKSQTLLRGGYFIQYVIVCGRV